MKHLILILICLCYSTQFKAQYIIAGQHGTNDYFNDIIPDTILKVINPLGTTPPVYYPIDINGDGIIDFELKIIAEGSMGEFDSYNMISPKNGNQVFIDSIGSCALMAHPFHANDTIGEDTLWTTSNANLSAQVYIGWRNFSCYDNNFNQTGPKYIGVRIVSSQDTLYGWIKVDFVGSIFQQSNLVLEEFACNKDSVGIENQKTHLFKIYPNPARDKLFVETDTEIMESTLLMYNINGQELIKQSIKNNITQIDISNLRSGFYFVKLINNKATEVIKIIIE